MESTLPFEYGFMYKPIVLNPVTLEGSREIADGVIVDEATPYFAYSGSGVSGYTDTFQVDPSKFFHPIAFIESTQKVICDVVITQAKKTKGYLTINSGNSYGSNGFNFSTDELYEYSTKMGRVKIDVNIFIKYFEKVL